ncbi:hypothetical protein DVH05_006614 [Phytophthora capsici]|nr:hypothetical protein DVH05_006614 [Phytophthora capsici]
MEAGIPFEEGYSDEEVGVVSSCSDDGDDDMDSSDKADANSEEEGTQEALNYAVDYCYVFKARTFASNDFSYLHNYKLHRTTS